MKDIEKPVAENMCRLASTDKLYTRIPAFLILGVALWANSTALFAQETPAERYARIMAEADGMVQYNEQLNQQIAAQQGRLAVVERDLAEIDATAAAVVALVQRMYEAIDSFVKSDLPFIDPTQAGPDSRSERMNKIHDLMVSETATLGEKYRRLMEAYQIELEYGRNMISYKGTLADGREADFLRLGRVSLAYVTVDGEESGYWDAEQKAWVVDNDLANDIERAVQVASKEVAPDLITLPIPAPREVQL